MLQNLISEADLVRYILNSAAYLERSNNPNVNFFAHFVYSGESEGVNDERGFYSKPADPS